MTTDWQAYKIRKSDSKVALSVILTECYFKNFSNREFAINRLDHLRFLYSKNTTV